MVDVGRNGTRRGARDDGDARSDAAREAQSRVEREAVKRTGRLSLAGLGLTLLPPGLQELSRLTDLDLSHNRIEQLPEGIARLVDLERLLLRGNRLAALPPSLTALTRLAHLDLANNQFAEIPRWLGRLELESIELGDAADLVHPPASVAARGTAAVLAYIGERDGHAGAQFDGGVLAWRPTSAIAENPAAASDAPTSTPPAEPTDTPTPPARSVASSAENQGFEFWSRSIDPARGDLVRTAKWRSRHTERPRRRSKRRRSSECSAFPPGDALRLGRGSGSARISADGLGGDKSERDHARHNQCARHSTALLHAFTAHIHAGGATRRADSQRGPRRRRSVLRFGDWPRSQHRADQRDHLHCRPPARTFEPDGDTLQISGLCMAVGGDAQSTGPRVVRDPRDASPGQVFVPQSGGYLHNPGSGLCVSETATGKKHQQAVVLMELCGAAGQQWNMPAA
jgi:hypothetical protein